MADKKKVQKLQLILKDVYSTDTKTVSKGLKALEKNGDSTVIRPLAERLLTDISEKNKKELLELLSSLKDTSIVVEMMDVLADKELLSVRQELLTTVWNMKVDFSDYVDEFVEIAVNGSFLESLDCLTVIENMEGPFMEENILESQLHLKSYLENQSAKDEQKAFILSEIAIKIKDFNAGLEG